MEHFYQNIEGWFDFEDVYAEAVKAAPSDKYSLFVEIGAWMGKSTAFMGVEILNSGKPINFVVVDDWSGSRLEAKETGAPSATRKWMDENNVTAAAAMGMFMRNIAPVHSAVAVLAAESTVAAQGFKDDRIDFCFLDADHSYEAAKRDIPAWLPKIKHGGVFAGHDICYPPLARAVAEALPGYRCVSARSWKWVKP